MHLLNSTKLCHNQRGYPMREKKDRKGPMERKESK